MLPLHLDLKTQLLHRVPQGFVTPSVGNSSMIPIGRF